MYLNMVSLELLTINFKFQVQRTLELNRVYYIQSASQEKSYLRKI